MADKTSEDIPSEEDVALDELDGGDPMQSTMESAADGTLPRFAKGLRPDIEEASEDKPTLPGSMGEMEALDDEIPESVEPDPLTPRYPISKPPRPPPPSRKGGPPSAPPHSPSNPPSGAGQRASVQPLPPPRKKVSSHSNLSPVSELVSAMSAKTGPPLPPSQAAPGSKLPPSPFPAVLGPSPRGGSSPPRQYPAPSTPLPPNPPGSDAAGAPSSRPPSMPPRPRMKSSPPRPLSRPPDGSGSGLHIPAPRMPNLGAADSTKTQEPDDLTSTQPLLPASRPSSPRSGEGAASQPHARTPSFGSQPPRDADEAALEELGLGRVEDTQDDSRPPVDEKTTESAQAAPAPTTSPGLSPQKLPEPRRSDYEFVGGDDETIDLAKTQKFERRQPSFPPYDEDSEDDGPPDIPMPGTPHLGKDDALDMRAGARRRGRKGKRRTVKIPDDNVPSTPTPPAVAAERARRGSSPPDDDDIYDAPTIWRPPPEAERTAQLPQPPAAPVQMRSDPPQSPPSQPGPRTPLPTPSPPPVRVARTAPPDDDEEDDGITRKSAPGIYTDSTAISVLRPIQIVSDLPAMDNPPESVDPEPDAKPPTPAPQRLDENHPHTIRRPLPPPRARMATDHGHGTVEPPLEEIEEIIPDRMSLPGPEPNMVSDLPQSQKRGPEPPATPPFGMSMGILPADPLAGLTPAELDLAMAEARLREAEARAREAEAKARELAAKAEAARKTARPPKRPWYQDIFEDDMLRTLDNPKKNDVERETNFIEKSMRLDKGSRILDLCCGTGVHAVELALRGYQVVGVDLSSTMLALAKEYNSSRGTSVSFIQGDMRKLNLEGVFDGIFCWSASFGYFDDQHNAEVLERVARALRPGGMFVLDLTNRDYVAPRAPTMAWFEKPGVVCMDEAKFDFFTSRLMVKRMVLFDTGKSRELEMSMRLYTLTEIGRLLEKVGFQVLEVSGHRAHRGAYFGAESPRIIVVSKRKGGEEES